MSKTFHLASDQIRTLAPNRGWTIASDRITVDGAKVGYMYREAPEDRSDSGWRFFAGDESESYMDEAGKFEVYDVNTIANYDPEVIPLLDARIGSAFLRQGGKLVPDEEGAG